MKKWAQGKLHIESIIALLTFGVFSCCVVFVLLSGVRVYERVNARDRASEEMRTCVQYLTNKVRQTPGAVAVAAFGDGDALVLDETIDGQQYVTWVYYSDGWLMELFGAKEGAFSPRDGQRVLEVRALTLDIQDGMLMGTVTGSDGNCVELMLDLSGGMK